MNQLVSQQTMLSTEIVKIINDMREEGAAELRHRDFMVKATKVLGEQGVRNFSHTYVNEQNGQEYACLKLPKREAHLMVMSENYKVQAAVYDKMIELEETVTNKSITRDFGESAKLGNATLTACGIVPDRFNVREFVLNDIGFDLDTLLPKLEVVPKAIEYQLSPSKRNPIDVLANGLGVAVKSINHVLYMEGYLDISYIPTRKAFGYYDYVNDEVCWSLPLVMRLLKEEGYKIR